MGDAGGAGRYVIQNQLHRRISLTLPAAYERQAHQARLRAEITRSKTEQGEYLRNVELARVLDKRKARKAAVDGNHGETPKASTLIPSEAKAKREYKQRKAPTAPTSTNGQMQSVLGSVFG